MYCLIRYWDSEANLVKVRFWSSSHLGHGTHKDVLEKFENTLTGLNPSKMIQVSMDRPVVNLKFLESLCNLRESKGLPGLIDYWCLSTAHNAFQTGAVKSTWNIHEILKSVGQIFHDSPAQRDHYISVTGLTSFPHNFHATRWIESKGVAERAKSLWEHVVKIVIFWKKLPNLKQPKRGSYNIVKDAVDDPLTVAKLEFFIYVAGLLEPYLKSYQPDQPKVLFIYFDLKKLVTCLLKLSVKAEVIDNCKTFDLVNIDLDKKSNFREPNNITLGFPSEKTLKDLKKDDVIEDSDAK